MTNVACFDYDTAFSRNLGWVSAAEQGVLRGARVAVAGMGGVGGAHLLTLARLGIGRFSIADFDRFDIQNFNRQSGAFMSALGKPKVDVLQAMASDINPDAEIRVFADGVQRENIDRFLDDVDVYVDGLDFFAVDARRMVFAACRQRGIPALTAAPLGMGTSLLYFSPNGLSFEDYFRLEGHDRQEQLVRFVAGLSPAMIQRKYLVSLDAVDFRDERGPSTAMACELCAGATATAVLKILLRRGPLRPAPWAMQFDAYRQRLSLTWRPWGNSNPVQRLLLMFIRRKLALASSTSH